MKRQRSRSRGGGGGSSGSSSSGKSSHNVNRAFDSNGPDGVKIRGHAQHVFEKYQQLARDAASSGDRVLAENYLQHAEHYFRVLRAVQPHRPASEIIGRDAFTSGIDIDFEDESGGEGEGETAETGGEDQGAESRDQQQPQQRQDGARRDDYRSDRRPDYRQDGRDNRQDRYEGRRDERGGYRDDRPRDALPRDTAPRDAAPRDDRSKSYRDERRDRYEPRGERQTEGRTENADPLAVVEPEAIPLPRASEDSSPSLRSQDGGLSPAPAFLQARTETPAGSEGGETSSRRRRSRSPRRTEAETPEPAEASED